MNSLWAPWRVKYIRHIGAKGKKCIFCQAIKEKKNSFLVFKTKHSLALLNAFPYNNGHLMVSPLRHCGDLNCLKEDEVLDLFRTLKKVIALLNKTLKPQGYNIGLNLGRASGAGVPAHLHIHIVPRWRGDTNFMPILAGTKVISQSLQELRKTLIHAHAKTD
jgi:ATP adenylyltransferase